VNHDVTRIAVRVVDVYPYRIRGSELEFLLLHRSAGKAYAGAWRMVGGKIREGERSWQAALREFNEETSLIATKMWSLPSPNFFYDWEADLVNIIPAFAVEARGDLVLNDEHDAAEWLTADAATDRLDYPEQRKLIRLIKETLEHGIPMAWQIPVPEPG
jgi:dihydroneopterin triphosphate diphosphatase